MRAWRWRNQLVTGCLAFILFLALSSPVDARARRYRKRGAVPVALQPFLLARSAVHAVADPIVFKAPRVLAALAARPVRIGYHSARPLPSKIFRGELVDEREWDEEAQPPEPAEVQPVPSAYYTSRVRRPQSPRAEFADPMFGDDEDGPRRAGGNAGFEIKGGSRPTVSGSRAVLRRGVAYAPSNAPQRVKNAIWAANGLRHKPYVWGGGHGSFNDRGYDCSGTVSFALHHAGVLAAPLPSSDFMRFGERGGGRWVTIYARPGHTFAVIAGLRLDTTDFENGGNTGPRWHADGRDTSSYLARHPAGL